MKSEESVQRNQLYLPAGSASAGAVVFAPGAAVDFAAEAVAVAWTVVVPAVVAADDYAAAAVAYPAAVVAVGLSVGNG